MQSTYPMEPYEPREAKRIRQACTSCRRKKIKCTGQRPICLFCRRYRRTCVYEPYSATISERRDTPVGEEGSGPPDEGNTNNTELLQRLITIEKRLADFGQQGQRHTEDTALYPRAPVAVEYSQYPQHPDTLRPECPFASPSFDTHSASLPPPTVLQSLIDAYFENVHNQPYSFFHEPSFRARTAQDLIPRCLLLAVLASAVRFSSHNFYAGTTKDATSVYAKESWTLVLRQYLSTGEYTDVTVVQTVCLLAIVDYTVGQVSSGWLKTGVAIRISQDLSLASEPHASISLSPVEQEEKRRAFWSTYIVDKLSSCGRARPIAIYDEDCKVQLPCDEQSFCDNERPRTPWLSQLLSWSSKKEMPSPFALTVVATSIFSRCSRYVHQKGTTNHHPPWDCQSDFSKINVFLLLMESYSPNSTSSLAPGLDRSLQQAPHLIFSQVIVHLCNLLLYHPFILRLTLKRFESKSPPSFVIMAIKRACEHARQLIDVLWNALESGASVKSSFYTYCVLVAGSIHSLAMHSESQSVRMYTHTAPTYLQRSRNILQELSKYWDHAVKMVARLDRFHTQSHQYTNIMDPSSQTYDIGPAAEEELWFMIDYGSLSSIDPTKSTVFPPTPPQLQSTDTWWLQSNEASNIDIGPHEQDGSNHNMTQMIHLDGFEDFQEFLDTAYLP